MVWYDVAVQFDYVDNGEFDDLEHNDENLCTRPCVDGEPPHCCRYMFTLEPYTTLARFVSHSALTGDFSQYK